MLCVYRPIGYLKHLQDLITHYTTRGIDCSSVFAIMLDSDTLWAVDDVNVVWRKFDAVRGEKEIVVSTEMNCWVSE